MAASKPTATRKPWKEEAKRLGKVMLASLRKYGGNPDRMRSEHAELDLRRPIPDPGQKPRTTID